jgi:hypothetical protein
MRRLTRLTLAFAALLPLAATSAQAADFGIRGGVYAFKDAPDKPFVGAELLFHAGDSIYFNPNVEYVFVDNGRYWTFNADAHWDLPTHGTPYIWLGGGLAIVLADPEGPAESDTSAHANLLAGIGFRTEGRVVPYIQVKLITGDPNTFVAAAGIRF